MLDSGKQLSYDQVKDVYHLTGGKSQYTFGRKLLDNGRKFGHYACDVSESVLIATVATNMRRFIKQQVSRARCVRDLMTRLAFTSSAALISIINHGIIKSDVTAEDVHNADSIWGPAVQAQSHPSAANSHCRHFLHQENTIPAGHVYSTESRDVCAFKE